MLTFILYLFNLLITPILLFFVLHKRSKLAVNRALAFFILSVFLWTITNFLADMSKDYVIALFWSRMAIIGPIFMPYFFVKFVYGFEGKTVNKWLNFSMIFLILTQLLFVWSDYNIKSVSIRDWGAEVVSGNLYYLLFAYFIFFMFFSIVKLFFLYKKSEGTKKLQLKYIFFGFFIGTIVGVFNNLILVILGITRYTSFGPTAVIIFIIFITYAIVKYKLLDINVVVTELLAAILVIISFLQLFGVVSSSLVINVFIFLLALFVSSLLIKFIINDTTRQEKLQELNLKLNKATTDLKAANKELQRLDDAKSEFLSIASHQLRTPVTIIKGYASMIIEGSYGKVSKKIIQVMKNVFIANDRLLNLIENLLDISRIEAGRLEFDLQPVNLAEVARPIVADFQQKAKVKGLKLQLFENEKVPKVTADTKKISEVISNIIDNSVKYTPQGEIIVSLHEEGTSVVFSCQDTGLGIVPEDLPRLFHKFVRGKGMMQVHTEGTGLGMYFARTVVENMGGRIWAESPGKNKGSKFSFSLPLADKKKAKKIKTI